MFTVCLLVWPLVQMTARLLEELEDYAMDLREAVIPAMPSRFRRTDFLVS